MPQSSIDTSPTPSLFAPGSLKSSAAKSNATSAGVFDELFQRSLKSATPPAHAEKPAPESNRESGASANTTTNSTKQRDSDASAGDNALAESDGAAADDKTSDASEKAAKVEDDNDDKVDISAAAKAAEAEVAGTQAAQDAAAAQKAAAEADAGNAAQAVADKLAADAGSTEPTSAKVPTGDPNSVDPSAQQDEPAKQAAEAAAARAKADQQPEGETADKAKAVANEKQAAEVANESVVKANSAQQAGEKAADSDADAKQKTHRPGSKEPAMLAKNLATDASQGIALPDDVVVKAEAKELAAPDAVESVGKRHSARTDSTEGFSTRHLTTPKTLQPTAPTNDAAQSPTFDRSRFVQRVSGAVRAAQLRDGRIQVRLSPPDLGQLRIELTVHHGAMTAKLQTETPAAKHALLDNLPLLRERLAEHEIHVEKFDVDVRDERQGSPQQDFAQDRQSRQPGGRQPVRVASSAARNPTTTAVAPSTTTLQVAADSRIDVRI